MSESRRGLPCLIPCEVRKCSPDGMDVCWAEERLPAQHRGGSLGTGAGNHVSSVRMEMSEEHKETKTGKSSS